MPIIEELQIFSISKHTQISLETYTEMLYLHILHKLQTMFLYKEQSGMESVEQQVLQWKIVAFKSWEKNLIIMKLLN